MKKNEKRVLKNKFMDKMLNRLKSMKKSELYNESYKAFNVENEKKVFDSSWIRQRIVNKIVDEGINLINFFTEKEIASAINKKLEDLHFYSTLKRAMKDARKTGGGAILLGVEDGQNKAKAVNYEKVKKVSYISFVPIDEITIDKYYDKANNSKYLLPEIYDIAGEKFHESRVIRLIGHEVDKPEDHSGFGLSVLQPVSEALKSFNLTLSGVEDIILEMTFKIFKGDILDLMKTDDDQLEEILKDRMDDFNKMLSTDGMAILDNKESIEKPVLNASGIDPILKFVLVVTSAAAEMPLTKLFGQQLGTLAGATETTRDWYDTVEAYRTQSDDELAKLINAIVIETNGTIPEDFDWTWASLYKPTATEIGEHFSKFSDTVIKLYESGIIGIEEARNSLNPENAEYRLKLNENTILPGRLDE